MPSTMPPLPGSRPPSLNRADLAPTMEHYECVRETMSAPLHLRDLLLQANAMQQRQTAVDVIHRILRLTPTTAS